MKKSVSLIRITAGLLWILPGIAFPQGTTLPNQAKATMHHEVPDGPYMPPPSGKVTTSIPARYTGSDFTMVQVNVDDAGNNILGDAANEPSLAINPVNPNEIVIGWRQFDNIASSFRQAGWGYSSDAGLSWTFPGVIEGGIFRSDPVLDVDANGSFFYNSLTSSTGAYTCKVFKSDDGGMSWDDGVDAHGGDKQWMVIDRTGGIGDGNVYSFWTSYYSSCFPDHFTRSVDGGVTYEYCVSIPSNPYWGTMAVGNNGELYVVGESDYGTLAVVKSSYAQDPGMLMDWDFASPVNLDLYLLSGLAINPVGLVGQANIDVDRSNGPGRDNIYVLASGFHYSTADSADVMFSKSTDGGSSWSSPVKINNDPTNTRYQWFGTLSVAPNGRIDVIWLDTRDATTNPFMSSLYYSFSLDQGETWSENERLTDAFDPHLGWPVQQKMGDYFDMESSVSSAHLAWANTFNGEEDVYYSVITPDITGVDDGRNNDKLFTLSASPVPFTGQTTITYRIPDDCDVVITLYNAVGKEIRTLISQHQSAGVHSFAMQAEDLPAGYYLCRMKAGAHSKTASLLKQK